MRRRREEVGLRGEHGGLVGPRFPALGLRRGRDGAERVRGDALDERRELAVRRVVAHGQFQILDLPRVLPARDGLRLDARERVRGLEVRAEDRCEWCVHDTPPVRLGERGSSDQFALRGAAHEDARPRLDVERRRRALRELHDVLEDSF